MTAAVDVVITPRASAYWQDGAACRNKDLTLFYGTEGTPLLGKAAGPGRRICARCPVRRDCLIDALAVFVDPARRDELLGLRAGYLSHELRSTLRRHGWDLASAVAAYDDGAFYQHPRRKPCPAD